MVGLIVFCLVLTPFLLLALHTAVGHKKKEIEGMIDEEPFEEERTQTECFVEVLVDLTDGKEALSSYTESYNKVIIGDLDFILSPTRSTSFVRLALPPMESPHYEQLSSVVERVDYTLASLEGGLQVSLQELVEHADQEGAVIVGSSIITEVRLPDNLVDSEKGLNRLTQTVVGNVDLLRHSDFESEPVIELTSILKDRYGAGIGVHVKMTFSGPGTIKSRVSEFELTPDSGLLRSLVTPDIRL